MNVEQALALTKSRRRWNPAKGRRRSHWHPRGTLVLNTMFPFVPERIMRSVDRLMTEDGNRSKLRQYTATISPTVDFWTFQRSLAYSSLRHCVRHFDRLNHYGAKWQTGDTNFVVLFKYGSKYIIWNGNHRITAAIMLGKRFKATVYTPRSRILKARS